LCRLPTNPTQLVVALLLRYIGTFCFASLFSVLNYKNIHVQALQRILTSYYYIGKKINVINIRLQKVALVLFYSLDAIGIGMLGYGGF